MISCPRTPRLTIRCARRRRMVRRRRFSFTWPSWAWIRLMRLQWWIGASINWFSLLMGQTALQTYAADIFFAQTWKDHRLRLPENMTSEYRLLEVEWLKNMWRPDSFFKNAKSVTFQTMTIPNHYMWLYKDKTILYMVKLTLRLSCAMNFIIYPHDTQECKLQMESCECIWPFYEYPHDFCVIYFKSIAHNGRHDISMVRNSLPITCWYLHAFLTSLNAFRDPEVPLVVDEHIELPQLALIKNYTADCTQVYSTGNFTCLEVVFVLKRRLGYYLFHTYIPTCLIVIMSVSEPEI